MKIRWLLFSNTTLSPLVKPFEKRMQSLGFDGEVVLYEQGEIFRRILDLQSGIEEVQPQVVFLHLDLNVLKAGLESTFPFKSSEQQKGLEEEIIKDVLALVRPLRSRFSATLLISNFVVPARTVLGIGLDPQFKNFVRRMNMCIAEEISKLSNSFLFDLDSLWSEVGSKKRDRRFEDIAQFSFAGEMQGAVISEWMRYFRALNGLSRKCVVVDLDNTLWGGILGEDGAEGVHMGDTPQGRPYRRLQSALKALKDRGILLGICSKNNPDEVKKLLNEHPDLLLRERDFAAIKANWDDKASNLNLISKELNIGLRHFVFLDDSPAERSLVSQSFPEILVPELPADPAKFADILTQCELDALVLTDEDLRRTEMVWAESERKASSDKASSYEEFLKGLDLSLHLEKISTSHLDRAFQLCQRTNQFNLTGRRYSMEELNSFAQLGNNLSIIIKVTDRFGDYGWAGLAIIRFDGPVASIDSLLFSCRILGKNVEFAFFSKILELVTRRGAQKLCGLFIPTSKNEVCANFYPRCGLMLSLKQGDRQEKIFEADIAALKNGISEYIRINSSID